MDDAACRPEQTGRRLPVTELRPVHRSAPTRAHSSGEARPDPRWIAAHASGQVPEHAAHAAPPARSSRSRAIRGHGSPGFRPARLRGREPPSRRQRAQRRPRLVSATQPRRRCHGPGFSSRGRLDESRRDLEWRRARQEPGGCCLGTGPSSASGRRVPWMQSGTKGYYRYGHGGFCHVRGRSWMARPSRRRRGAAGPSGELKPTRTAAPRELAPSATPISHHRNAAQCVLGVLFRLALLGPSAFLQTAMASQGAGPGAPSRDGPNWWLVRLDRRHPRGPCPRDVRSGMPRPGCDSESPLHPSFLGRFPRTPS